VVGFYYRAAVGYIFFTTSLGYIMTTVEKIILAKSNKQFTLFKEGLFYKCYNEDAMLFVKRVKNKVDYA